MNNNTNSSLRPGWYKGSGAGGGKGFQPPPTASDRGEKSRSNSTGSENEGRRDANKFAALLDDDDGVGNGVSDGNGLFLASESTSKPLPVVSSSRSEAFRSSFNRSSSIGSKIGGSGRSLADLAARVPDSSSGHRRHSNAYDGPKGSSSGSGRFSHLHSNESSLSGGITESYKPDPKVIRYTREKLLSLRSAPRGDDPGPPKNLKPLVGSVVISTTSQDPVCWDTLDAEEIWDVVREQRRSSGINSGKQIGGGSEGDRRRTAPNHGRWQRGVALPPTEDGSRRKERDADNPNELWDDPVGGVTGAASDFSSFGTLPSDDNAFDFEKMTEASAKLEKELHGVSQDDADESEQQLSKKVDISRPLASAGTTLVSGSGNGVNVFEDFDTPVMSDTEGSDSEGKSATSRTGDNETPSVRGADEDPSASSRLMKMIGVARVANEAKKEIETQNPTCNPWGSSTGIHPSNTTTNVDPIIGAIGGTITGSPLSLNPWGDPVIPNSASQLPVASRGMNLGIHLSSFSTDHKIHEEQIASENENIARQEAELLRRRQEEEEEQRRALAQQNAEERARRQHTAVQQQPSSQQAQIELVLMERICTILENSWGRSDLVSILTTLHSEDSRVIPLLGNIESLHALISRSPQRVSLRRDTGLGGEIAVLLLTNAQWQEQQQHQARIKDEEIRRRQMEEEAKARIHTQHQLTGSIKQDSPWFYSDPQNNIQGPFRGEEMRQWLEAGYFKGDLPISQVSSGPFHRLSNWFPDLNSAFRVQIADSHNILQDQLEKESEAAEVVEKKARAEEAEAQKKADDDAAAQKETEEKVNAALELERYQKPQISNAKEIQVPTNGGNQSSTQLKMMLGLASGEQAGSESERLEGTGVTTKAAKNHRNTEKRTSKETGKKSSQKHFDKSQAAHKPEIDLQHSVPDTVPVAPPAPAWGGIANNKPRKSMSEIQQEEARAAAILAAKRGSTTQSSSSGWANVAAGSTGWSSGAIKSSSSQNAATVIAMRPGQTSSKPQPGQGGANRKVSVNAQHQRATPASSSTPAEEFGATMPPALEKWCKEKMHQINGSDDLTLVAFCMTLNDANEIRQYLTTYLGLTTQVNSFATEFINKRGLGSKQEEWETPANAKKGRKKKSGR